MNNKFDEPRERSCPLTSSGESSFLSRGELAKGLAQSVTRREAFKKFGVGLAGMALACLGLPSRAEAAHEQPPPCRPNGYPCTSWSQCCSRLCVGGMCKPVFW